MGNSREEKHYRSVNYTPIFGALINRNKFSLELGSLFSRKLDINLWACIGKGTVLERFVHPNFGCLHGRSLFQAVGQGKLAGERKKKEE